MEWLETRVTNTRARTVLLHRIVCCEALRGVKGNWQHLLILTDTTS